MRKYRLVAKKGEGTFSEVLKAQNIKDGKYHAIKCMKNRFDSIDQVNNLREIQALRRLSPHDHIITLEEVLYDQPTGRLALVFELMDANLYELIRGRRHYLNATLIKSYMYQLLKSLDHMHRKGIFHRDIKPENILIESTGELGQGLKLADFGSCRGIYSKQPYTEYISTRWYRAPECLLTDGYYGPEMDLWGAGCVYFEITSLYPLFPGTNEIDQVARIHKVLGTPEADVLAKFKAHGAAHVNFDFPYQKGIGIAQLIPHASPDCIDLMIKLLKYDATDRITAREALRHVYFKEMRENDMRRQAAQRVPGAMPAAASQAPEAASSTSKTESSASTMAAKLGHSLGSTDHGGLKGLSSSATTTTTQQPQPASMSSSVGGGGHNQQQQQSKGLPTIGGASSSSTVRKESIPRNTMPQASLSRYSNNHSLKNNPSNHLGGDSKSGLPPIIGAVLGNTGRSSKLSSSLSSSTDHKSSSSRLHETKKAVKRKSKGRIFESRYKGQTGLAPGQGVLVASGTKVRKSATFHVGDLINA